MADHTTSIYDGELKSLARHIAEMGGIAEGMIVDAMRALVRADAFMAKRVIAEDRDLDHLQRVVEENAVRTIARRQPMASDLREIIAALRVANDLERCGDLAKNIARRAVAIQGLALPPKLIHGIEHISELTQAQLARVLDAYVTKDVESADFVWRNDDEIDAMYTSLFRELLTYMMEDPRNISSCTHLLFCAKNVERIGDHATNIAETVIYQITGVLPANERPKQDDSSTSLVN
jgi:phosphate transport system protein